MKNRRKFLQLAGCGFIGSLMTMELPAKGIISQPEEGETYFVRENTPITIYVSKKDAFQRSVSVCTETMQPGGAIPVHKHLNYDEFFIFQKGSGVIDLDGEEHRLQPGTIGWVPRAAWHGIKNTGSGLLVFTFGYSPAGFEDFFRQIGTPEGMPFKAKTAEETNRIAEKYGMVFK